MMGTPQGYILDTDFECERLDRQGLLLGRRNLLTHFSDLNGKRVLDAGSGSGWATRVLAQRFPEAEIVGIDVSPRYIEYARRATRELGLRNVSYVVGDLQAMPLASDDFDVVWSQFVLYFLPDAFAAVKEFKRVTRAGGRVSVALHDGPLVRNFPEEPGLQPKLERLVDQILPKWTNMALPQMFGRAGLANIEVDIRTDKIFTMIGRASPSQLQNVEEVLSGPARKLAHIFGSPENADTFLKELSTYLLREDTSTITTYWVVSGEIPY